MELLANRQYATFRELFSDIPRKFVAIVTFIAMLELARTRRIRIMQSFPFAELRVYRGEYFESGAEPADRFALPVTDESTTA
jgi:chromatin segregation and condensation protein Rec8/ScpA/Scc1 (kleisin family)